MSLFSKKTKKPVIKTPVKSKDFGETYMLLVALEDAYSKVDKSDKHRTTAIMANGVGLYIEANYEFDNDIATKLAAVLYGGLYSDFNKEAEEHGFHTAILHLLNALDDIASDDDFKHLHNMVMQIEKLEQKK